MCSCKYGISILRMNGIVPRGINYTEVRTRFLLVVFSESFNKIGDIFSFWRKI